MQFDYGSGMILKLLKTLERHNVKTVQSMFAMVFDFFSYTYTFI